MYAFIYIYTYEYIAASLSEFLEIKKEIKKKQDNIL